MTQRALKEIFTKLHGWHFRGKERLLEIGSGIGFLRRSWPRRFKGEWVQLDAQKDFTAEAQRKFPQGTYVTGSAYDLPFPARSFDYVYGYCSFDVLYNVETAVKETARVLKSGGVFFHMLDIGASTDVVQNYFQKERIPLMMSRDHKGPYSFGMPSKVPWNLRYIPCENLPAFLEEVGMTPEEMDACERIDSGFALDKFLEKKRNGQPLSDFEDNCFEEYETIFDRHARKIDVDAYFKDNLMKSLSKHFGEENIGTEKLRGRDVGRRTESQAKFNPEAFYFMNDVGALQLGAHSKIEEWDYKINQALARKYPRLARLIEPHCYEEAIIDCVVAKKP